MQKNLNHLIVSSLTKHLKGTGSVGAASPQQAEQSGHIEEILTAPRTLTFTLAPENHLDYKRLLHMYDNS